jgi:integrase
MSGNRWPVLQLCVCLWWAPSFVRIALLAGMRAGEITSLIWGRVDLANRVITVGRAKDILGNRQTDSDESRAFQGAGGACEVVHGTLWSRWA